MVGHVHCSVNAVFGGTIGHRSRHMSTLSDLFLKIFTRLLCSPESSGCSYFGAFTEILFPRGGPKSSCVRSVPTAEGFAASVEVQGMNVTYYGASIVLSP